MSHVPVARVLAESHFADQSRFSPMPARRKVSSLPGQWRSFPFDRRQALVNLAEPCFVKSGSHSTSEVQQPIRIVVSEQQRAEVPPRSLRVRPSHYYELLAADAFDLQPVTAPIRQVNPISPL